MYTKKSLKTTESTEHNKKIERDFFTEKIIGCAIEVHRNLGPGLLQSTYKQCLARELTTHNIKFFLEHPIPVNYKGIHLECGYRIDILCESSEQNRKVILELKSVEEIINIQRAQLLTYMKLANIDTGLLMNFNVTQLKDGIERFKL